MHPCAASARSQPRMQEAKQEIYVHDSLHQAARAPGELGHLISVLVCRMRAAAANPAKMDGHSTYAMNYTPHVLERRPPLPPRALFKNPAPFDPTTAYNSAYTAHAIPPRQVLSYHMCPMAPAPRTPSPRARLCSSKSVTASCEGPTDALSVHVLSCVKCPKRQNMSRCTP